jgi:hypothetical protein
MQVEVYCYVFVFFILIRLLFHHLLHCNPTWVLVFYSRPSQAFIFDKMASVS